MNPVYSSTSNLSPSSTTSTITWISEQDITNTDILCGKGFKTLKNHPGNVWFRKLLLFYLKQYKDARSPQDRSNLIKIIVDTIKTSYGGRFLMKADTTGSNDDDNENYNDDNVHDDDDDDDNNRSNNEKKIEMWYELPTQKQENNKVSHAIRTLLKQLNDGKLRIDDDSRNFFGNNEIPVPFYDRIIDDTINTATTTTAVTTTTMLFDIMKTRSQIMINEKKKTTTTTTKKKTIKNNTEKVKNFTGAKKTKTKVTIVSSITRKQKYVTDTRNIPPVTSNDNLLRATTMVQYNNNSVAAPSSSSSRNTIGSSMQDDIDTTTNNNDDDYGNSSIQRLCNIFPDIVTPTTELINLPVVSFELDENDPIKDDDKSNNSTIGSLFYNTNNDELLLIQARSNNIDDNDHDNFHMDLSVFDALFDFSLVLEYDNHQHIIYE